MYQKDESNVLYIVLVDFVVLLFDRLSVALFVVIVVNRLPKVHAVAAAVVGENPKTGRHHRCRSVFGDCGKSIAPIYAI